MSWCALCSSGSENNWRIFIDCLYAQTFGVWQTCCTLWMIGKISWNYSDSGSSVACNVVPFRYSILLSMILWSIWISRNDKLRNEVDRPASVNISLTFDLLQQWINARKLSQSSHNSSLELDEVLKWQQPPSGYMKCNTDATIFKETQDCSCSSRLRS